MPKLVYKLQVTNTCTDRIFDTSIDIASHWTTAISY